ncbi:DUF1822 family protein [Microcoleus sp. PH2017_30_WIL_O_A]|uniref:DUF1822 family protein n=1 Tax=Microcoleus sp. PH2017_30_WIL_O_A TaxID=2798840 RepID=UPI001D54840E|nr:DUF1822 family protein [Microcoleus sp. PH2017_30_WIL_O_A]MCC3582667.1 DUF1822 family protein [Microcoleus sp. PH2017_30_WIL_O_A]
MKNIDNSELTIQLSKQAHQDAHKFASQQSTPEKVKQVYTNTLAVYAVRHFLQWLGIETDLSAGDSWHPVIRCFNDVADLVIPNLGKLECRPVLPGQTAISIPSEVTEDRIAYIAVQFQEQLNEVQLLGFYPAIDPQSPPETIEISRLQPIETLIDYIDRLESAQFFLQSDEEVAIQVRERLVDQPISEIAAQLERIYRTYDKYERRYAGGEFLASYVPAHPGFAFRGGAPIVDREGSDDSQQTELQDLAEELLEKLDEIWGGEPVNQPVEVLRQWLEGIFREDWQSKEAVLTAYRRSGEQSQEVSRVKLIELGSHVVALLVSVGLDSEKEFSIHLRLYPAGRAIHLPEGIQLTAVDDESGEILLQAQAEETNDWIQIIVEGGTQGDRFSVKVAIGDITITESFAI